MSLIQVFLWWGMLTPLLFQLVLSECKQVLVAHIHLPGSGDPPVPSLLHVQQPKLGVVPVQRAARTRQHLPPKRSSQVRLLHAASYPIPSCPNSSLSKVSQVTGLVFISSLLKANWKGEEPDRDERNSIKSNLRYLVQ